MRKADQERELDAQGVQRAGIARRLGIDPRKGVRFAHHPPWSILHGRSKIGYPAGACASSRGSISPTNFAAWANSKLMPLQCRQVGNRRPLITVTSSAFGARRIVCDRVDAGLRHDSPDLYSCAMTILRNKVNLSTIWGTALNFSAPRGLKGEAGGKCGLWTI
jgi:hypothetical protein